MTTAAFFLAFFAFFGCLMLIVNPLRKLTNSIRGKKKGEIAEQAKVWIDENPGDAIIRGCGYVLFFVVSLMYAFIIEPFAILWAITRDVGNLPLAYAMLVIAAIAWLVYGKALIGKKVGKLQHEEKEDEVIALPSPAREQAQRIFFALPTLYLWYLFVVVIGWI